MHYCLADVDIGDTIAISDSTAIAKDALCDDWPTLKVSSTSLNCRCEATVVST